MNFLSQTLSTFTGGSIPYNFGKERERELSEPRSPWRIYEGTKKDDGSPVTIFSFDDREGTRLKPLALNAIRRIRSIRLPNILKIIDTYEGEQNPPYIVTERVTPLTDVITEKEISDQTRLAIIYYVTKALKLLNVEGSSVLGYLSLSSVFINEDGEVRLGGFELMQSLKDQDNGLINSNANELEEYREATPPELASKGYEFLKSRNNDLVKVDSWRLASFIYKLFNESVSNEDLPKAKNIPKSIVTGYKNLIRGSPSLRASVELFLKNGENTYFNTPLIRFYKDLEEFQFKTEEEKLHTFEYLNDIKNDILPGSLEKRIIPEISKFFQQYPAHAGITLNLILSLSENLPPQTYSHVIKPVIIKAFALPDRAIRIMLLSNISNYIEKLDKSDISDKIFTNFVTGFADSNPLIREETIKATLFIVPKLSDRQLNNDLLRFLAKVQMDEKPEIRTNTTILLGKIAQYLNKNSRASVLATAFSKALKDNFIHSRLAAIMAISSCIDYFTPEIISNKILTVIAPSLLDRSSKVRNEAQKAFDLFFQKIKIEASKLPIDKEEDDDAAVAEVTSSIQNFGMNFSNALSKFAGINNNQNSPLNTSVPEFSRSGTPGVVASFEKATAVPTLQKPVIKKPQAEQSWDDMNDLDESWGDDASEEFKPIAKPIVPATSVRPKVTRLATESTRKEPATRTKKSLQLKPKSKIKLQLDVDENDSWGDGW